MKKRYLAFVVAPYLALSTFCIAQTHTLPMPPAPTQPPPVSPRASLSRGLHAQQQQPASNSQQMSPLASTDVATLQAELASMKQSNDAEHDFIVSLLAKLSQANAQIADLTEQIEDLSPKPAPTASPSPSASSTPTATPSPDH